MIHFFRFRIFFTMLFILLTNLIKAQTKDSSDAAYFLDDGKIGKAVNVVKINLASLVTGDLSFSYERKLNKTFAMEGSAGVLLPYYVPEVFSLLDNPQEIVNPKGGYSFTIQPKIYYFRKALDFMYTGIQYRKRHYNLEDATEVIYNDISLNWGYQFFLGNRLMLDYHLGIGFRFKKHPRDTTNGYQFSSISGIVMPLALKLGYNF